MIDSNYAHITRGGAVEAARRKADAASQEQLAAENESLIDFCAHPACRKQFQRTLGPGRKQEYCSEFCRRSAQSELRQKRARLAHFERIVEMLRVDIAGFGKTDFDSKTSESQALGIRQTAEDAVHHAAGALTFANPDDLAVRELKKLYDAVVPLVLPNYRPHQ